MNKATSQAQQSCTGIAALARMLHTRSTTVGASGLVQEADIQMIQPADSSFQATSVHLDLRRESPAKFYKF